MEVCGRWMCRYEHYEHLQFYNAVISTLYRPILHIHLPHTLQHPQFLRTKIFTNMIIYLCFVWLQQMEVKCQFKKDKPDEKRHKIIITGDIHKKGYATEVQHNVENRYERSRSSEARIRLGSSNKKILKNRQKLCGNVGRHKGWG